MSECLRKISERVTCLRIDFFGEKIDIVRETERGVEKFARIVEPAAAREKIDFPKTAERERAFAKVQAAFISINQTGTRQKFLANARVGLLHARRGRFGEPVIGEQEQVRIDLFAVGSLGVSFQFYIPPISLDLFADALAFCFALFPLDFVQLAAL